MPTVAAITKQIADISQKAANLGSNGLDADDIALELALFAQNYPKVSGLGQLEPAYRDAGRKFHFLLEHNPPIEERLFDLERNYSSLVRNIPE